MDNQIEPYRILAFAALTLSVRILTWISLIGGTALFTYAVLQPTELRIVAASCYAVLMFLPAIFVEKRRQPVQPKVIRHVEQNMQQYAVGEE